MRRLPLLFLLFASAHAAAGDWCDKRGVVPSAYPLALTLADQLCRPGVTQDGLVAVESAKESSSREMQWLAQNWTHSYGSGVRVAVDKIVDGAVADCDGSAQSGIEKVMIYRRRVYDAAVFFGRIPAAKPLQEFSDGDATAAYIARIKASCGVDLGAQKITWQVLDK